MSLAPSPHVIPAESRQLIDAEDGPDGRTNVGGAASGEPLSAMIAIRIGCGNRSDGGGRGGNLFSVSLSGNPAAAARPRNPL